MRIVAPDDIAVILEPDGYQFPGATTDRWDSNWLIIAGNVETPDGSWSFRDACLTTFEGKTIGPWLRSVANDSIPATEPDSEGWVSPNLIFTEPTLAFSVASRARDTVELRVHLSLEGAPPWLSDEQRRYIWQFFVTIPVEVAALEGIAASWEAELAPFPERGTDR